MTKKVIPLHPVMPRCWDNPKDWAEWVRLNRIAGTVDRQKSLEHFCNDCTPEYAASMTAVGRCAYPDPAQRPEKVTPRA